MVREVYATAVVVGLLTLCFTIASILIEPMAPGLVALGLMP